MKRSLLLIGLFLSTSLAQADIVPTVVSSQYIATARYNGGSVSYAENAYGNGPLSNIVSSLRQVPYAVESALNTVLTEKANSAGASFLRGSLTGNPTVTIAPQTSGVTLIKLEGWSYEARTRFTGKKLGFISYDCVNTTSLRNLSVTGQYGTQTGQMASDKAGATADVSSSTDCDSNLSWILPFVGDLIIGSITSKLDARVVSGIQGSLALVKDKLLFDRQSNFLSGLNKLVPADKVITLPNGSSFALGQYLQNYLAYLIGNSQLSLKLAQGVQPKPRYGGEPSTTTETGDLLDLSLTSPAFSFGVSLIEQAQVRWNWVCSWQNPNKQCYPDY